MAAKVDWKSLKAEYITDATTSYRSLGTKYGVNYRAICARSQKEGWLEQREQYANRTTTRVVNAIGDRQVDRAAKLVSVADLLLDKVKVIVEDRPELLTNTQSMKHLSGVLKDIKEVQMIRSDAELREQEARIKSLEKAAAASDTQSVTVLLEGGADEYVS